MAGPLILLIEDEPQMRRFLRTALPAHDYRLLEAGTIKEGLALAASHRPDLILLDLGLPDGHGLGVVQEIRGWSTTPIIVLSASGKEDDKVCVLDAGADDYLTKPFGVPELLARMRVALRHAATAGTTQAPVLTFGDLVIDLAAHRVRVADREIHLTPTEFKLLAVLARHPGKVLTHRFLLKEVWGPGWAGEPHVVRVYMGQLRRKIEADPARPAWLRTEVGVGYRFHA